MSLLSVLLVLSLAAYSVRAAPNSDVIGACKEIATVAPVVYSGTAYKNELKDYWSYACAETKPYCVVQPTTPEHVAAAVKVLNKFPEAQFAVKSGGHDPNVGHSSIHEGVLIALGKLKGATYDRARDVAYVKPGGKWATVIGDLAPSGVAVVGGRLCKFNYLPLVYLITDEL
jgi:FAD/FMN-containing dehydrogenase